MSAKIEGEPTSIFKPTSFTYLKEKKVQYNVYHTPQ